MAVEWLADRESWLLQVKNAGQVNTLMSRELGGMMRKISTGQGLVDMLA